MQSKGSSAVRIPTQADIDARYSRWVKNNLPDYMTIPHLEDELERITRQPLVDVVIFVDDTTRFITECLDAIRGQVYDRWHLYILTSRTVCKSTRQTLEGYAKRDTRITLNFSTQNQSVMSVRRIMKLVSGEYISFVRGGDILWPNALYEVAVALNRDPEVDFLYTDEDKITDDRRNHFAPLFKPDWNPDFLHSVNYVADFAVVRRELYDRAFRGFACDQDVRDFDWSLQLTRYARRIGHVAKVVYSRRYSVQDTDRQSIDNQRRAIESDVLQKGDEVRDIAQDAAYPFYWNVQHKPIGEPLVSIVMPTKNQYRIVKRCVRSIFKKTTYRNYEIILVDTGSTDRRVLRWYKKLTHLHANITIIYWHEKKFSYAASCNEGARAARGSVLVMLNNDTEVLTPNWLEVLVGEAQREDIGAVGPLLLYPDKKHIQHAGIGVGLGGIAANSFSKMTLLQPMTRTQHTMVYTRRNVSAVTGACLAIRKEVFDEVHGFDDKFQITYNDVDLCLRLMRKGLRNVYTPHARLVHHESLTLGLPEEAAHRDMAEFESAKKLFVSRWKQYIEHDPNINTNLNKSDAYYEII